MSGRHSDEDGSDHFWPGYVDAVTNLVLNLLFLLTIMTVAVFMFALELGRASKGGEDRSLENSAKKGDVVIAKTATDPVKENIALKREIERLNGMLAERDAAKMQAGGLPEKIDVTAKAPQPQSGLDKALPSEFEIIVRFVDDAVAFTPEEHTRLLETLKPVVEKGKSNIYVEVPTGFSEAKRMGYYRAMAVRNLLLEMKMPAERINVSVLEGKSTANASIVRVR